MYILERISNLGVEPLMGFCIALDMMTAVTSVKVSHMITNRNQKFFRDMQKGIAHIPTRVTN